MLVLFIFHFFDCSDFFANSTFLEFFIILIIESIFSTETEIPNSICAFSRALFNSNFIGESKMIEDINPLLNTETFWKPHALLLMGDYFVEKKEYIKAKEFYTQILLIKNLQKDFYDQAKLKLILISND